MLEAFRREPDEIKTIPGSCPECGGSVEILANEIPFIPAGSTIAKKYVLGTLEECFGRREDVKKQLEGFMRPFKGDECAYKVESRPGVFLDRETKSVRAGYFYRAERVDYYEGVEEGAVLQAGYCLDMVGSNIKVPERIVATLGGERGLIELVRHQEWESLDYYYSNILGVKLQEICDRIADIGRFKLWLLTPCILLTNERECIWNPERSKQGPLATRLNLSFALNLEGAVIGKAIRVSGWDYAKNRVKEMYVAIPSGSLYYYGAEHIDFDQAHAIIEAFTLRENLSDESFLYRVGFGTVIVCGWGARNGWD
jgi:CRISPR type III-B/RAMP module-associated protein Cmr3